MRSASSGLAGRTTVVGVNQYHRKVPYRERVLAAAPGSLLAYWPMNETSGTQITDLSGNAWHGVYTGVTLGTPGSGDGGTAPFFDGVSDYGNLYTAGLAAAFTPLEFSLVIATQINAPEWTDGISRGLLSLAASATNRVRVFKSSGTGRIDVTYLANSITKTGIKTGLTSTGWIVIGLTVSKSADEMKVYVGGVQEGATLTGLGDWSGLLGSTGCIVGAFSNVPASPFLGKLAHFAIWTGILPAQQMLRLGAI